ncbi:MAG: hypothetical protein Q8S14_00970 [Algoriphagus sp.]|uniref:hypothetical protein n=1 Tax=Algoriphagus sp. TaxID=1872435 RepID=UPI00272F913B|nr:hypothetical protein [Algoriphagus sp.]MDP2039566.1 hypothetical protein [Algoriphagus sp.]MDP3470414.1 hypothetical protein [Algoriphagus sp.]
MLNSTTIGATFRLSTLILILLCSPALSQQSGFSTPETSLEVADTIFRRATNSPGYLVVKEADWDRLKKVWKDSFKQKEELLNQEQKKFNAKVDSLQQIEASTNHQEPSPKSDNNTTNTSDFTIPILALGILIIYGTVTTIKLISQKIGVKTQIERLYQLEKDLELHKRNSIERERKLMRELIDVQNELEEEKSRQNQDSE